MKKRVLALMMVCVMSLGLAACGDDSSSSNQTTAQGSGSTTTTTGSGYKFTYNGTDIYMNAEASAVISKLGTYKDKFETDSCAFQGKDRTYTYNGFKVYTYEKDGKEYILSVELTDDSVKTAEGVEIGSKKAKVVEKMGNDFKDTTGAYKYTNGKSTLTFVFKNDEVSSISYDAITD